jgi:hypothetical protein
MKLLNLVPIKLRIEGPLVPQWVVISQNKALCEVEQHRIYKCI